MGACLDDAVEVAAAHRRELRRELAQHGLAGVRLRGRVKAAKLIFSQRG